MRSIGVRELRQHASKYLRAVEQGETIEVTDRGRPVAQIVPLKRAESRWEQLVREGLLVPGTQERVSPPPIKPVPGIPLPSEILAAMREHER